MKKARQYYARKAAKNNNNLLLVDLDQESAERLYELQKEISEIFKPRTVTKKYIIQYAIERMNREDIEELAQIVRNRIEGQKQSFVNRNR